MQMLSAGGLPLLSDGARAADIDNPRGYYELERIKKLAKDQAWLGETRGRAIKVVSPLLTHLPVEQSYRVLMIERDLLEVLASQAAMLERRGHTSEDNGQELKRVFSSAQHAARQWLRSNGVPTLDLSYRDVVHNAQAVAAAMAEFVGGLDVDAMAAAVDVNLYRHRR